MRWTMIGVGMLLVAGSAVGVGAEERKSDRVIEGVLSGLLGTPQQSPESTYTAQERDRLVSLLQSGQYVTSRQGETIDMMVYGVPLTRVEHVYTAKPIPPAPAASRQNTSP